MHGHLNVKHGACFGRTDHPQTLKYLILKFKIIYIYIYIYILDL